MENQTRRTSKETTKTSKVTEKVDNTKIQWKEMTKKISNSKSKNNKEIWKHVQKGFAEWKETQKVSGQD